MPKRNGQGANGNNVQPNEEVQNGQVNEPKHPEPKKEEPKKAAQKPDPTKAHNVDGWDSENYFYDSNAAAKAREAAKQDKEGARKKISLTELSEREGVQKKREFTNRSVESRTHEANMKKVSQTGMKK